MQITNDIPEFGSLENLKDILRNRGCHRCSLGFDPHVNGVCVSRGNPRAKVMIIAEAPGKVEDSLALPFTGPAGQLLDKILASVGIDSNKDCYLTNSVLCRPYAPKGSGRENYTPQKEQVDKCRPFLDQQIKLLDPKIILLLGKVAVDNVLPEFKERSMKQVRGRLLTENNRKYFIMYHPSYLLRSQYTEKYQQLKEETWQDAKNLKKVIEEINNE